MQQVITPRQISILVATEDRALARQVSQFLDTACYQVLQAAEPHMAMAAIEAEQPQMVLIGAELAARDDWAFSKWLAVQTLQPAPVQILMAEEPDDELIDRAFEEGVDDILLLPLDFGELLARLRAAARTLEFDRRNFVQHRVEPLTGLLSRSALLAETQRELTERIGSSSPRVACVAFEVDFVNRIRHRQGAPAVDTLFKVVAGELNKLRSGAEMVACLEPGQFAAVLPGATDTAAVDWAEHARRTFAALKVKLADESWQITASFGVAGCDAAESAADLINQAVEALAVAKTSGSNCVVRHGEIGTQATPLSGKLFQHTDARAVMKPVSVLLGEDEPVSEAVALFKRTRYEGIPVVDAKGKLVGLCEEDPIASAEATSEGRRIRDVMTTEMATFPEHETLISLLDFFTRDSRTVAVIVRDGTPVGLVTCTVLAGLSQPVTDQTFATTTGCETSEYLLVPDCCDVDGADSHTH